MTPITYAEFLRHLESYGTAVHCELYANCYSRCSVQDQGEYPCYFDRGCVIDVNDRETPGEPLWIWRSVHQVTPDAEIEAVVADQMADARRCAEGHEKVSLNVIGFTVTNGDLTPEQNAHHGWRNFVRQGCAAPRDPAVRRLTEDDLPAVKALCAPSLTEGGDTNWGRMLANDFDRYSIADRPHENLWGLFDGNTLVGVATTSYEKGIDLGWLRDVFIAPAYRQKGHGRRLVLSALADFPDKKWHYQVARDNAPSVALARALGFTLEGAGLYYF